MDFGMAIDIFYFSGIHNYKLDFHRHMHKYIVQAINTQSTCRLYVCTPITLAIHYPESFNQRFQPICDGSFTFRTRDVCSRSTLASSTCVHTRRKIERWYANENLTIMHYVHIKCTQSALWHNALKG